MTGGRNVKAFLGIDVGSVSTNLAVVTRDNQVITSLYLRTRGQPIKVVQEGLKEVQKIVEGENIEIAGVGTTGSARNLTGVIVGADVVKNEITAHAVAALRMVPGVQTVLELGGQDSKIILLRDNVVIDFAMNTVCAAGTGSFLDHQADRLGVSVEKFGDLALKSNSPVRIAGRCSVFAESDMIHKQQMGHPLEDIIAGLCEALVRNYLNNVGKGKDVLPRVVFQGGVAANSGIKWAFEKALELEVVVPPYHDVMGAIGAAFLAQKEVQQKRSSIFRGFDVCEIDYNANSFECDGCSNNCEIVEISRESMVLARWGSRCGKWEELKETG